MEVKLTGGTQMIGKVNPRDLTPETYEYYCRLYLIERIYEVIPVTSEIEYRHVAKIINAIDPVLFRNLNVETNRILLLNEIYSRFMTNTDEQLSREFLYDKVAHIASYDPALYTRG